MPDFDVVIRGGELATASSVTRCDVGIRDGRVAALEDSLPAGAEVLDAAGKLVLPGGIDAHCHIAQLSSMGVETADGFTTATASAACGGTTTVIPFAAPRKGQGLRATAEAYEARARGNAVIDYGYHLIISDPTETVLREELPGLVAEGHTSVKIFMTYDALRLDDRQILQVLARTAELGVLVMVHAENHDLIGWLTDRLLRNGDVAPRFHAVAHAPEAEREAVHRVIALAEAVNARVHVVHLSAGEAIDEVRSARARGLDVVGETCPQYLVLTSADLDRPGFEGAKFVCSPPPREATNQGEIWRGIEDGVIQVVASDHAGYRFDGPDGKKIHGDEVPFHRIPNGVPGLETRLPILFSEGVTRGRIDLPRFVQLSSTNAARVFGPYPRKGTLDVGADADIAIWDPERRMRVSIDALHDNMDYTPYEGMDLVGWPVTTLSRGRRVWHEGEMRGIPGWGNLLRRGPPDTAALGTEPKG